MITPFGDWVRQQRQSQGLSQEQLAQKIEKRLSRRYTGNHVAKLELGTPANPTPEVVSAYAAALERPLSDALYSLGYQLPSGDAPEIDPDLHKVIVVMPFDRQRKLAKVASVIFENDSTYVQEPDPPQLSRVAEPSTPYNANGEVSP